MGCSAVPLKGIQGSVEVFHIGGCLAIGLAAKAADNRNNAIVVA